MKPSVISKVYPWSSVLENSESEVVAQNIAKILKRTGDDWRELTEEEYVRERTNDGNFSTREADLFHKVKGYLKSGDTAKLFCTGWKEALENASTRATSHP
jgi:hypothetical protein